LAFKGGEGFGADVVFHTFGVEFGDFGGDAEGAKEGDDGFVAAFGFVGEAASGVGEKNGAVRLGVDESGLAETKEGAVDGDVGDAETPGEIHHAGFAEGIGEIGNGFDVILGGFAGAVATRAGEVGGLLGRGAGRGGGFPFGGGAAWRGQ
jgi:hypothetical protein